MFNSSCSAASNSLVGCGLLGLCMVPGYSQIAEASLINVTPTASGSASFARQFVAAGLYTTTGPATLSTTNAIAEVGSSTLSGNHYASAKNSYTPTSTSLFALVDSQVLYNTNVFNTDFNGTATSSLVVTFEVDQTEFYTLSRNVPQSGSSYVFNHTTALVKVEGLVNGNPVTVQSWGVGQSNGPQFLLTAGVPYTFTFTTSSTIPKIESGIRSIGIGGTVTLGLVPEPTTAWLIIPAAMYLVRRRIASKIRV